MSDTDATLQLYACVRTSIYNYCMEKKQKKENRNLIESLFSLFTLIKMWPGWRERERRSVSLFRAELQRQQEAVQLERWGTRWQENLRCSPSAGLKTWMWRPLQTKEGDFRTEDWDEEWVMLESEVYLWSYWMCWQEWNQWTVLTSSPSSLDPSLWDLTNHISINLTAKGLFLIEETCALLFNASWTQKK